MLFRRVAILTALACLAIAAPAAASERSEARAYAAALQVGLVPSQAEIDGWLADSRFRADYVAATCLDVVKQGAKDHDREGDIAFDYVFYAIDATFASQAAWSQAVDERLAAIPTSSPTLRRGRRARRGLTGMHQSFAGVAAEDFCVEMREWQAKGWKGRSPTTRRFARLFDDLAYGGASGFERAVKVLKRHGATKAQLAAFAAERPEPEQDLYLDDDLVLEALGMRERESPDGGPVRRP